MILSSGPTVDITDIPLAEILVNPDREIAAARDRGDYFTAFALSVAYFEYYGSIALKKCLKNPVSEDRFSRLSTTEMASVLYGFGMLDKSTFQTILEVNVTRNDLVHPDDLALKYKLDTKATDALLDKAMAAIKTLREKAGIVSLLASD